MTSIQAEQALQKLEQRGKSKKEESTICFVHTLTVAVYVVVITAHDGSIIKFKVWYERVIPELNMELGWS